MKSIRVRILATYIVLAVLLMAVLITGLYRLKAIAQELTLLQSAYLPAAKTVNSFFNFPHLDESFDHKKVLENSSNLLFMTSVTQHYPKLLETALSKDERRIIALMQSSGKKPPKAELERVLLRMEELKDNHKRYVSTIESLLENSDSTKENLLMEHKKSVRSSINLLSRLIDSEIENGIRATVIQERRAVFITLGLSFGTFILALAIGFFALLSLKPLAELKIAAERIGKGDFSHRAKIHRPDEVGELANTFNQMADSIQTRNRILRDQQEQLVKTEQMAAIGRMAAKISHEVRNPLNAISLNVELLEDETLSEDGRSTLHSMANEIARLNRVAEFYLDLSRSNRRSEEETFVEPILQRIQNLVAEEAKTKGIELSIHVEPNLPKIKIDGERLQQALLNLIRNAMEAIQIKGECKIRAGRLENQIQILVEDSGPGIPEEVRKHIFEPFYTTKEKGTGLGLAITHEIVREADGQLYCHGREGGGTVFEMLIPVLAS